MHHSRRFRFLALGALTTAGCSAEYAEYEPEQRVSRSSQSIAACDGDDLQYDFNAFAASLAVATANELGRWDALADFEVENGRLRLSPTGEIRCDGWRGDAPGGCENVRAILALQGDETDDVPYHSPALFREKLTTWHARQEDYLTGRLLDAARFPGKYLVQSRSNARFLTHDRGGVRTGSDRAGADRWTFEAVGDDYFQIRNEGTGRCLSTGVVSSSGGVGTPAGENLSLGAGSDGSSKASGTSYGDVRDGKSSTYWSPSGWTGRISVKWSSWATLNTVVVREAAGAAGNVGRWRLINHDDGRQLASGSGAGTIRFDAVTSSKVDFVIDSASGVPAVAELETYFDSTPATQSGPAPTLRDEECGDRNSTYFRAHDLGNGYHGLQAYGGWALVAGGTSGVALGSYDSGRSSRHWELRQDGRASGVGVSEGVYGFFLRHSGRAVAVDGGKMDDGALIEQRTYEEWDDRYHWYMSRVGDAYEVINRRSGKCLDLETPWSSASTLVQRTCDGSYSQKFRHQPTGDGYAMLITTHGRAIEVRDGATATDTPLVQGANDAAAHRQLLLSPVAAGEPHELSFSHSTSDGPCGDYYWYDITQPNGAPLHAPQETFVQLLFAGGKQTLDGEDENPFIAQQVSGNMVAIDPSGYMNGNASGTSGSCVASDILFDRTGSAGGRCCIRFNGRYGRFERSFWSGQTFLCR